MSLLRLSWSLDSHLGTYYVLRKRFDDIGSTTNSILNFVIIWLKLDLTLSLLIEKRYSIDCISSSNFLGLMMHGVCKPPSFLNLLFFILFIYRLTDVCSCIVALLLGVWIRCFSCFVFFIVFVYLLSLWHLSRSLLHPLILTRSEL